ncbi:UNVERIFIED_CONTAM: Histone H1 [Sesamum radiatum]|uniref:Histone H1 n=1 Tax=Sesamum radiatum TaxID=300843 RepID=A0AAW2VJ71_SESRA
MDPALDPPPPAVQPTAAVSATAAAAANPTPAQPPVHIHPPYAEMITAAIAALKERNGSSKRAIAKYIETHYANLPPTHSALLTHHLKRLKINGQVLMVKPLTSFLDLLLLLSTVLLTPFLQIPLLLGPSDGLAGLPSPSPKQVKLPCPFLLQPWT